MTPEQGDTVARRMNASYIECSSKEMRGVDEVFALAVHTAVSQEEQWASSSRPGTTTTGNTSGGGSTSAGGSGGGMRGKKIKKRSCKIL